MRATLRHPSYLGLREDKKPESVVLEVETPVAEIAAPAASKVKISNRDRVIFPESSITKGQLADYYAAVATVMLPWLGSRPMSLVRCPQGRAKKCFFQKHDAGSFGDTVKHVGIMEKDGHEEPYLFIDDGRWASDLRSNGHDRVSRLGRADRGRREGGPAGLRS